MNKQFPFILLSSVLALFAFSACAGHAFKPSKYSVRKTIECRILSVVQEEDELFTDVALVTSFVEVDVLSPQEIAGSHLKLILQRAPASKRRIPVGQVWKPIGKQCLIDVYFNTKAREFYLVPDGNN